jgi:hypothetical protein
VLKISENERESKKKLINHKPKTNENQEKIRSKPKENKKNKNKNNKKREKSLLTSVIDCAVAPFCNGGNEERDVKENPNEFKF